MDKKAITDEKKEQIISIAKYVILTGSSMRKTGVKYNLSAPTIHDYLTNKLPEIDEKLYLKVKETIEKKKTNRANVIKSLTEMQGILIELHEGKLLQEIALEKGISPSLLSRYIHADFPKIDIDIYNEIVKLLEINSKSNLSIGNPNAKNQPRDEKNRFKK